MAGNVYSTYELAKKMAYERQRELEQDIFICKSNYQSGQEFTLKTKDEMMSCNNYLHMLQLSFRHHFGRRANAEREADKFASKKGLPVYVKTKTKLIGGYDTILYYYLTHKEPCSTSAQ